MHSSVLAASGRAALLLAALLALAGTIAPGAQVFPELTGRVVDGAGVIPPEAEARLAASLEAHEGATRDQVVVVTLPSLQGYPIEDFGYRLGRHWRIGTEDDDGVLLVVAPTERRVRIEVGYGLEPTLTDAASRAIIDNAILPAFRDGDLARGIEAGTAAILAVLETGEAPAPPAGADADALHAGVLAVLVALFFAFVIWRLSDDGGVPGKRGGVFYPGTPSRGAGRRSGGFSGRGGFSGGGGSFGGGGASGSW